MEENVVLVESIYFETSSWWVACSMIKMVDRRKTLAFGTTSVNGMGRQSASFAFNTICHMGAI